MRALLACGVILASALAPWQAGCATNPDKPPEAAVLRRLPPLDAGKLDPNYREEWKTAEFSDEKRGIFIHVVDKKQDEPPFGWISSSEFVTESGAKWVNSVSSTPQRKAIVRIRLSADTISYLITTPEAPLLPRYIALREIFRVEELSQSERLEMIELASRDVRAEMRCMAVLKAGEYAPLCDAIPILCRALCDPSGEVTGVAREPLIRYFFPDAAKNVWPTGKLYSIGASSPEECREIMDRSLHSRALRDARRIHKIMPDLVTEEDLATIEVLSKDPAEEPEAKSDAQSPAKPQKQADARRPKAAPATP